MSCVLGVRVSVLSDLPFFVRGTSVLATCVVARSVGIGACSWLACGHQL